MIHVLVIDRLGWGFVILGSGLVMLIIDLHKNPRRCLDAFLRGLVIMCVSVSLLIIVNEVLAHTSLLDEEAAPTIFAMSQGVA